MNKRSENITNKILEMYTKCDFPDELTDEIQQWITSECHKKEKDDFLRKVWDDLPFEYELHQEDVLKDIKNELGIRNPEMKRRFLFNSSSFRFTVAVSIAAMIVGTMVWFNYLDKQDLTVETPLLVTTVSTGLDETRHADIIEGTQMWVNQQSNVTYTDPMEIELNGEAFFDVSKIESGLFSVKGNTLKAIVTGTKFNFRSYDEEDVATISLYEGRLNVFTPDSVWMLNAGYELEYNKATRQLTIRHMERERPDWMRNIINFDNAKLIDIFRALEKIYDITIDVKEENMTNDQIELKFEGGLNLEEVMYFLSIITGSIDYTISGDIVYVHSIE